MDVLVVIFIYGEFNMRTELHVVEEDRINCLERQKTDGKKW